MNELQTLLAKRLSTLSAKEMTFLKTLVYFGGACTRADVQKLLGIKDVSYANRRLTWFVEQQLLVRMDFSRIPGLPNVYSPSRALGVRFGCDRRIVSGIESAVEKCFRFSVASTSLARQPASCFMPDPFWKLEFGIKDRAARSHRDDPICEKVVLVDVHPHQTPNQIRKRFQFWTQQDSSLVFEVWCHAQSFACDVYNILPPNLRERVTEFVIHRNAFCDAYAKLSQEEDDGSQTLFG